MKALHAIAFILVIIGGLNWLLFAFGWDVVRFLPDVIAKIVYILVGISAIILAVSHKKDCKNCTTSAPTSTM